MHYVLNTLAAAAGEADVHVVDGWKTLPDESGLTRPDEAATEGVCMAVHGYLRAIGQRCLYSRQEVVDRLNWCLANGASADVFIRKYLYLVKHHSIAKILLCNSSVSY
jgi:hypothetical protein